jgi:DNA-directed RNA polymerase subunit L
MDIKILKDEKDELEVEVGSLTLAEVLRVYLNQGEAKFAAWKRNHPTKNPILHVQGENPKKLLKKAIESLEKDIDKASEDFKKLK